MDLGMLSEINICEHNSLGLSQMQVTAQKGKKAICELNEIFLGGNGCHILQIKEERDHLVCYQRSV